MALATPADIVSAIQSLQAFASMISATAIPTLSVAASQDGKSLAVTCGSQTAMIDLPSKFRPRYAYIAGGGYTEGDVFTSGGSAYYVIRDYTAVSVQADLLAGNIFTLSAKGSSGINYCGPYSATTTYSVGDGVTMPDGTPALYVLVSPCAAGNAPAVGSAYWGVAFTALPISSTWVKDAASDATLDSVIASIHTALDAITAEISGRLLPIVTSTYNNDTLSVVDGAWAPSGALLDSINSINAAITGLQNILSGLSGTGAVADELTALGTAISSATNPLPAVTTAQNQEYLGVVGGVWAVDNSLWTVTATLTTRLDNITGVLSGYTTSGSVSAAFGTLTTGLATATTNIATINAALSGGYLASGSVKTAIDSLNTEVGAFLSQIGSIQNVISGYSTAGSIAAAILSINTKLHAAGIPGF